MSLWFEEALGLRKRDGTRTTRGTELRSMHIDELSGVDEPAHGFPDWLLLKATRHSAAARDVCWGQRLVAGETIRFR
jgi:hypothetical protein